jgi:MATE family multidrug resistance protein
MAVDSPTALTEPLQPKDEHLHEDHSDNWDDVWGEVKEQLKLAYPIIGMNVVQLFLVLSSAAFVGHLGALSLASAQLATSLANATGHYLLIGMALGLETLGGQAVGAGQYAELGYLTQLCIIVLVAMAVIISLLWTLAEPALLALGQDPTLARLAAQYMHLLIPSVFANAATQPLIKFLQSQGRTHPLAWAATITLVLHIPNNWFFIFYLGWGLDGAAIATSLAYTLMFVLIVIHVGTSERYVHARPALNLSRAFRKVGLFLQLGFFSTTMLCLEFISFDLIYIMAGWLQDPYRVVSALSVAMNTAWLLATGYIGLGNAVSTRVATELGRGSAVLAKKVAMVGLGVALALGVFTMVSLLIIHQWWPLIFIDGSDTKLLKLSASLMVFVSFTSLGDSIQNSSGAILRGCGRQMLGASITLTSYYIIGVPASVLMGLVWKWGPFGLFGGFILATFSQATFLSTVVSVTNWKHQVEAVKKRQKEEQEKGIPHLMLH